jgi:uncharacterized delta-60 repeat protein
MKISLIIILFFSSNLSVKPNSFIYSQLKPDSVQLGWVRNYISGYSPAFDFSYAIAVDPSSGNIYVAGSSYGSNQLPDVVTIKYNSSGDTVWVRRYNGPDNNWDDAQAMAVDAAGNVYVTGKTYSDSTFFNYVTIKYSAAGVQEWVAQYDGPSNNDDGATAIAVDGSGNVYVTGHSWQSGTSWDYATIKYNCSGQQLWVSRYNGPGNIADFATGLALDPSDNVYVTGTSDDLSVNFFPAYATVKYNSDGVEQWVARYNELWSYASAIAVDESGNAYVTGRSYALGTFYDYATVKYNTMGVQQWVTRYNGPGTSDDYALALALDASGNVYVTGEAFFEVNNGSDYATIKYNASGVEQWVGRYNGPGSSVDVGNAITLDADGNVYVAGESRGVSGDDDFATVKYSQTGDEQWVVRFNGSGDTFDLAAAIALDASRNIYVTGRSTEVGSSIITTIKYEQIIIPVELTYFTAYCNIGAVELNWSTATELNNRGFEIERSTNKNNWRLIGFREGRGTTTEPQNYSFVDDLFGESSLRLYYRLKQIDYDGTFEYSPIVEVDVMVPIEYSLEQNFPNPFNPSTTIEYRIPSDGFVSLTIYNTIGQEVSMLVNENQSAGNYSITFSADKLPSGLYFYSLRSGDFSETRKMLLLK